MLCWYHYWLSSIEAKEGMTSLPNPAVSFVHDSVYHKYQFHRCLLIEPSPRVLKSCTEKGLPKELCFYQAYSWPKFKKHLSTYHKIKLYPSLDTCDMCYLIFPTKYHAISHFLTKVVNYD